MLRAAVIIVLLGLITVSTIVLSIVALTKGGFELGPGGLKIEAYKPPEVQMCLSLTSPQAVVMNTANQDTLVSTDAQLNSAKATLETQRRRHFEIAMELASDRKQYEGAVKTLAEQIKSTEAMITSLQAERTRTIDARLAILQSIRDNCGLRK